MMRRTSPAGSDGWQSTGAKALWLTGWLLSISLGWGPVAEAKPAPAARRPGAASGPAADYRRYCAGCHGVRGRGGTGDDLRGLSDTVEAVAAVIANGQGKMPPFRRKLSAGQHRRLAAYVKGFR